MSFQGYHKGKPVYDYLEDVPYSILDSGRIFIVLYPPEIMIRENGAPVIKGSITILSVIGGIVACIFVAVTGLVVIGALKQQGYNMWGRPADVIDDNTMVLADGTVIVRDGPGEPWRILSGPYVTPTMQITYLIIVIGLITAAILLFIAYQKGWFGKPKKEISKPKKKTTTKNNPGRAPKKWWDRKYKEVKEDNPDYSDHMIRGTVGKTWYQNMSESERKEIIAQEE